MRRPKFINKPGKNRAKWDVLVHCRKCGIPNTIKWASYKRRGKKPYECRSCAMSRPEVRKRLSASSHHLWQDPAYRERNLQGQARFRATDEWWLRKMEIGAQTRAWFADPNNRAIHKYALHEAMKKDSTKKAISEAMIKKWQEQEYRHKVTKTMQQLADELWGFRIDLARRLGQIGQD